MPWVDSWKQANEAFYSRYAAEDHFATPVSVSSHTARKVLQLLKDVREGARNTHAGVSPLAVVDIGSGSGTLLRQLTSMLDTDVQLIGVDTRPRPDDLAPAIQWRQIHVDATVEDITGTDGDLTGVVIAHEFLDDIPCPVVELDDHLEAHVMLIDPTTGSEEVGPTLHDVAARAHLGDMTREDAFAWLQRWWPPTRPMARREIGLTRDRVWRRLTRILREGFTVGVDYAHRLDDRRAGIWDSGTVKGFFAGSPQSARPDGTVNITAHVALDSCAGPRAQLLPQSEVFATKSLDSWPAGLGSFDWLIEAGNESWRSTPGTMTP
jgi:SAM-dependent MidA family methyltransferase